MEFTLKDQVNGGTLKGSAEIADNGMLLLKFDGFGEYHSDDGAGIPVLVELYQGEPRVIVWSDINKNDHTHLVGIAGAAEQKRLQKCAYCEEPLEPDDEVESTPHGSMHGVCRHLHEEANPGDW